MKFRVSAFFLLAALIIFVFDGRAFSHPHVFIENKITIIFDQKGLAGIRVKWVFDEFFSTMIACDYDKNHNSNLENSEIALIKNEAFTNLANFAYFTFIKINGKPFQVKYTRDFTAILSSGKLTYEFLIPCHVMASVNLKEITISQYDPTYYTFLTFTREQPVTIKGGAGLEISYHIAVNRKETYYFGQIHPVDVILQYKLKNE